MIGTNEDLARTIELIDKAMESDNKQVRDLLKQLLLVTALVEGPSKGAFARSHDNLTQQIIQLKKEVQGLSNTVCSILACTPGPVPGQFVGSQMGHLE